MDKGYSELKVMDREILLKLPDKEFLVGCQANKYIYNVICDENFVRERLRRTYPDTLQYYLGNISWKRYYLEVIHAIANLQEKYGYKYTVGNPILQNKIFDETEVDIQLTRNQYGFNVTENEFNDRLFRMAVRKRDFIIIEEAIRRGIFNPSDVINYALFMFVHDLEGLKFMLQKAKDLNITVDLLDLFYGIIESGSLDTLKYILEIANFSRNEYVRALAKSLYGEDKEFAEYLIKHTNITEDEFNETREIVNQWLDEDDQELEELEEVD